LSKLNPMEYKHTIFFNNNTVTAVITFKESFSVRENSRKLIVLRGDKQLLDLFISFPRQLNNVSCSMVEYFVASILISEDVLQQKFFTIKGDQSPSHFGHLQVLSSRIVVDVIDSTAPIGSIMSILYNTTMLERV